jgi:hypothetical protein
MSTRFLSNLTVTYEVLESSMKKHEDELKNIRTQLAQAEAIDLAGQWETVTISSAKSPTAFVKVGHGAEMEVLDAVEFRKDLRELLAKHCAHQIPEVLVDEILSLPTAVMEE